MENAPNLPAPSKRITLRQIFNLIPEFLVPKLARETGVQDQARTFSPWSHVVALGFSQLAHAIGLNDVCDALQLNSAALASIRGATPPSRNNLSHSNTHRDATMAERLFWAVFEHLGTRRPAPRVDVDPTDRRGDGLLARLGFLDDAPPIFGSSANVPGAGVLLAVPALVQCGIFECAEQIYGNLGRVFFGLRTTLFTLRFMAL